MSVKWFEACHCPYVSVLPKLSLEELSLEQFHRIIDVNLLGAFLVSKVGVVTLCSLFNCVEAMLYLTQKNCRSVF